MKKITSIGLSLFIVFTAGFFVIFGAQTNQSDALDGFAQCLTDKGFTMYGAYWCPHCQNEKARFGDSFRYVNYVECTENPNTCTSAGIKGFPTWITRDARRFEGEQGIEKLSEVSGCSLAEPGSNK